MAQIVGCREGICLSDLRETERIINEAGRTGLDLAQITEELEREGVSSFCDSYHALLECIRTKLAHVRPVEPPQGTR